MPWRHLTIVSGPGGFGLVRHLWKVGGVEASLRHVKVVGVGHALNHVVEVGDGRLVEVVLVQDKLADRVTVDQGELAYPGLT